MSNLGRMAWEILLPADELSDAAKTKLKYHKERHAVWTKKQAEVMKKVRAKGLSIHEDLSVGMYANTTKVMRGAQILVDESLQNDLNECHTKLQAHSQLIKDYKAWVDFLYKAKPSEQFPLTHQDYLFFFGE